MDRKLRRSLGILALGIGLCMVGLIAAEIFRDAELYSLDTIAGLVTLAGMLAVLYGVFATSWTLIRR